MADTIFTGQTPASSDFDGLNHGWGMEFTVTDDCNCTGGRAYVPAGGRPGTFFWQLWRISDTTKIAETNLNAAGHGSPSSNTWMSFDSSLFTSPGDVALESAEDYIVNVYFVGDGLFTDPGSFPVGSGGLVSSSTGRFNNGSGQNAMPADTSATYFFADLDAEADGGPTEYEQPVSGSVTPSGALRKSTSRALAGSATPAASLSRQTNRTLAGSTTATGSLAKETSRTLSGQITPAGAITRTVGKALEAAITPAATITRAITRTLSGSVSPAGVALKAISRLLGGSITPSGSVSDAPGSQDVATSYTVGQPHGRWNAGKPHGRWDTEQPSGRWHIGNPRGD